MICDTTFLSDLLRERADGRPRGAQSPDCPHGPEGLVPLASTIVAGYGWCLRRWLPVGLNLIR